jgi:hypothetical protein
MCINSKPVEMSRFPSIRADETYNGCSTINMQKAANNTDLLMLQDVVKQLDLIISRRHGATADASGCIAMHFIQTPSMYNNLLLVELADLLVDPRAHLGEQLRRPA